MPISVEKPISKTAEQIMDVAEMLIQTRGYSAFSYADIAEALGIRKASIHYHFPSKSDLGLAVVNRYVDTFGAELAALSRDETITTAAVLERYMAPYFGIAGTPDRICLCGALAGEVLVLPPPVHKGVARFFDQHQQWLADILTRGEQRGEVKLAVPAAQMARLTFAALQGALLIRRATDNDHQLADVTHAIKSLLLTT